MQSIETENIQIKLSDELWEVFTLQAQIEAMRQCGRNYALTPDEMRRELIIEAAQLRVKAKAKLDNLRRRPVDVSDLLHLARVCFISTELEAANLSTEQNSVEQHSLEQRISELETKAQESIHEVVSDWMMLRCGDWIKVSVLSDEDPTELIRHNITMLTEEDVDHPAIEALTQALVMMARDYKKEFEYLSATADDEGWEIVPLQPSIKPTDYRALAEAALAS